jgi:FtsP/CotA-like multicopper oxidase with cupredoxin domain
MAERYDVVIDFSSYTPGTKITLLNTAADGDMRQVMQFVVGSTAVASQPIPDKLNDIVFPRATDVVTTRHFKFDRTNGMWAINGLTWNGAVAARPKVGTTEKWVLETSSGGWFHPVHIHLVDFQILRRNSSTGQVFAYEKGWKDVAYVGANETLELLMTFHQPEAIDPTQPTLGKFVMHCHNLVHEDHDMMNQFEIQPGTTTSTTTATPAMTTTSTMVQWELEA